MPFFASSGAMTVNPADHDPGDGLATAWPAATAPTENVEYCKILARGGRFVSS